MALLYQGFPTTHDEDWRFTNVTAVAKTVFETAAPVPVEERQLEVFATSGFACRLVFINGYFDAGLSRLPALPKGVKVSSLAVAIHAGEKVVEESLGKYLNVRRDAFPALNTALFEDGVCIEVPQGARVDRGGTVLSFPRGGLDVYLREQDRHFVSSNVRGNVHDLVRIN